MDAKTMKELGLDPKRIEEAVVEQLVEQLQEDSETYGHRAIEAAEARILERADETVAAICEEKILGNIDEYVRNLVLQKTNSYGEPRGEAQTFTEWLVEQADAYLTEDVNYQGKNRKQDNYDWRSNSNRLTYMINEHLESRINTVMKAAIGDANERLATSLEETVNVEMKKIAAKLKTTVTVK